jgi:hypothetical protein
MESTRRANEEASREQIAVWEQVKDTLDEHTRSLQAQGNIATRLAERMYVPFLLRDTAQLIKLQEIFFRSRY